MFRFSAAAVSRISDNELKCLEIARSFSEDLKAHHLLPDKNYFQLQLHAVVMATSSDSSVHCCEYLFPVFGYTEHVGVTVDSGI